MATVKRCNIPQSQVEHELDQAITSADPVRAESFQKLHRVRTIKTKNQERERLRLTEKLGSNHPRVLALQAKIDNNKALTRNLQLETARAQTEAPVVDKDSWVVYGRVLNNQLKPVPGMKAALYDKSGCPIQTCGSEYTDKTGYFKLTIKNVADDTRDATTKNEPMEGFLYVLDKDNVTVHKDKRPLPILAGQVQYLEVVLDDGDVDRPPQSKTRYLGNSNSKELHDLKNQKPNCQIDEIKPDHRVNFKTQKEALALDYDYCAYCFGKDKSKR
jgi:hypothetical protein